MTKAKLISIFTVAFLSLGCDPKYVAVAKQTLPKTVAFRVDYVLPTGKVAARVAGSGVFINNQGLVLTCAHLFDALPVDTRSRIQTFDGVWHTARVLKSSHFLDLALVQTSARETPYVEFAYMKSIKVGEEVMALGSPLGIDFSISNGVVTGLHRDLGFPYFNTLQTNAAINPGNSGGPLVDLHGRLVGINVASMSPGIDGDFSGIGFAVPADVAQTFILEYLWR